MSRWDARSLSAVIPLCNEEESLLPLHAALTEVLRGMGRQYEILFVDDGSRDRTPALLRDIAARDEHVVVIRFRTNFGQSAAMAAGFRRARGAVVVSLDGDLQNDPRDIPRLVDTLEEGYDLVSGWRKDRKDTLLLRKIPSRLANRLICRVTGLQLHDTGCSLKAYRSEVIKRVSLYGELHRFIPTLAALEGARIAEVVVHHHPRRYGRSKYTIARTFKVVMDLTTLNLLQKYLRAPFRYFGLLGLLLLAQAGVVATWWGTGRLAGQGSADEGNILIALTALLAGGGVQFMIFGLIADLVARTGRRARGIP